MGSIVSSLLGGDATAALVPSAEPSRVTAFHSSNRWQLHFNSFKQLNQLLPLIEKNYTLDNKYWSEQNILSAAEWQDAATESTSGPSRVTAFHSSNRWQLHFNSSKQLNKLIVVDFSASWCGPCKFMEPVFNDMSSKYTDVDFAKIDVDELSDVAKEFAVQAMPTFVLLKQGKEVERVVGAKKDELEKKILKHREAPKFAA
ncbi:Thioredoxin domain-containing protein [Forsythia ovata]|uniref:Thioredoxin domain-containing protein n=1 Tax=Forsythia ovata TaxID=205694 RepID=A0ABD1WRJ7_9LAMI